MRRAAFLFAGVLWLLFAAGVCVLLLQYLSEGAGSQFAGSMVSSLSVAVGLVHIVGFVFAALLGFTIGAALFARGFLPACEDSDNEFPGN